MVYPVNQCGQGYNPTTLTFETQSAPSAPLFANAPINTYLTAATISFAWSTISSSDSQTGGYPVTSYQILWTVSPSNQRSVFTLL